MTRFIRLIPFALSLVLATGLTSAAERSDLVGTWEFTSVSQLGTTVRPFVVPKKGTPTLGGAPIEDLVIDDNEIPLASCSSARPKLIPSTSKVPMTRP